MKATMVMMVMMMMMVMVGMVRVVRGEGTPAVRTEGGWVTGIVERSLQGRDIYTYRAIPFVQPPVGRLRLKPPEAVQRWDGVRNCTDQPPMCLQADLGQILQGGREVYGSEDCLYLNVHTPGSESGSRTKQLPVMVYIHQGAFFTRTASDQVPYALLDHDVILVVLQYRLGILGFLSTEDEVLPGNLGMLDQVEGMRWVQRNIQQFGGDPDHVTIFGVSAGSASVHYHLFSPMTKGLFTGAIMSSGSALNPWARGESFREVSEKIGRGVGCPDLVQDSQAFLHCLQQVPAHTLVAQLYDYFMLSINPVVMAPRVDGVYLPDDPAILLKEGRHHRVPAVFGTTSHEGCLSSAPIYGIPGIMERLTESPEMQLGSLELGPGDKEPYELANRIFRHYLGGPYFGEEKAEEVTQMYGDRQFVVGLEVGGRQHALTSPTYTYQFTYVGQHSLASLFAGGKLPYKWVCHGDELLYLFAGGDLLKDFTLTTPQDLKLQDIMVQLWVNFAKTRNPTPDGSLGFTWTPFNPEDPHHLNLTPTPTMAPTHRQQMLDYWASLPLRENLLTYPQKVVYEDTHKDEL